MIEVAPGLFVGNAADFESLENKRLFHVIHACKEPYHRMAVGYTTPGAPQDDPEYLVADRGNEYFLNLIDAPDVRYIPKEVIDAALNYIDVSREYGKAVLIHCNEGKSRAPGIAFLWMAQQRKFGFDVDKAIEDFKVIYPEFEPGKGMLDFIRVWYSEYNLSSITVKQTYENHNEA